MKIARVLIVGAIAIAGAGCDGIFGNDDDNFTFAAQRIEYTEGMVNEAEISGLVRTIQVDGIFLLPHPCHDLRGSLRRTSGGDTEVVITASPTQTCQPEIQAMDYRMQTLGFSRGFFRVRVYHEIQGQPRTLISQADIQLQ